MIFEAQTFFIKLAVRLMPCTNSASDAFHLQIPVWLQGSRWHNGGEVRPHRW